MVPEAILFYLFINFYGDNYILPPVYLLVLIKLNLDKLVKVYEVLPFLNTSYQYPFYSNHKFENLTKIYQMNASPLSYIAKSV